MRGVIGDLFLVLILVVSGTNVSAKLSISTTLQISCGSSLQSSDVTTQFAVQVNEGDNEFTFDVMGGGAQMLEFCCELSGTVTLIWMPVSLSETSASFQHVCCVTVSNILLTGNSDSSVVVGSGQICSDSNVALIGMGVKLCSDNNYPDRRLEVVVNISAGFQEPIVLQDCDIPSDGTVSGCSPGLCNITASSMSSILLSTSAMSTTSSLLTTAPTLSFSTATSTVPSSELLMSSPDQTFQATSFSSFPVSSTLASTAEFGATFSTIITEEGNGSIHSSTADMLVSSMSTIASIMTSSLEVSSTSTMDLVTSSFMEAEITSPSISEMESAMSSLPSSSILYATSSTSMEEMLPVSSTSSVPMVSPLESILTSLLSPMPVSAIFSVTSTHNQPDSSTMVITVASSSSDFTSSSGIDEFSFSVTPSFPITLASLYITTSTSSILSMEVPATSSSFSPLLILPSPSSTPSPSFVSTKTESIIPTSSNMASTSGFAEVSGSSPSISPSSAPTTCPVDGIWPETVINTIATGTCFKGAVKGTRHCSSDGSWHDAYCESPQTFLDILMETQNSPETALQLLQLEVMESSVQLTLYQQTFLLYNIYQTQVDSALEPFSMSLSQEFLDIASELVTTDQDLPDNDEQRRSIGSTLLQTLDDFALELLDTNTTRIYTENIVLAVVEVQQPTGPVTSIDEEGNNILIPVEAFVNPSSEAVRVVSFYYRNLSLLLPPARNNTSVASSVISSTTDCDLCPTQNLMTNITITFSLTTGNLPRQGYNDTLTCVFWEFADVGEDEPLTGSWSEDGCHLMEQEGEAVICACNHLTHFAILLSPGVEISDTQQKILTYTGYAIIPISLLALLLTMFTFIFFRSLWSMRNYIHIMLCANLFVAQLLFVVGIERTENETVCTGISVALQYLFLVTFMWMLMEGVVLYVSLVRVFIVHTKRYIIAYTVASYGIPALYLSVIVPIGFTLATSNTNSTGNSNNYLLFVDNQIVACWLNYDNGFVWTFIAPVITIILVNVGFLIMALVIMYRHRRKTSHEKRIVAARYWIKACISLVVLMGIAWLFNVLFFVEELIFIAYVMTVFISSQGVIIFFLFVVLSKQSREAYAKWWHNKVANSEFLSSFAHPSKSTGLYINSETKKQDLGKKSSPAENGNIYVPFNLGSFGLDDEECSGNAGVTVIENQSSSL